MMVANSPLIGAKNVIMLRTVTGENLNLAVIHFNRNSNLNKAHRGLKVFIYLGGKLCQFHRLLNQT